MPAEVSSRLQHRLTDMGVHLLLKSQLQHLSETEGGIRATLDCNRSTEVDVVVAATGLRPETALAHRAGAETGRGVKVNSYLQTTQPDIYAWGLRGNQRRYCLSCSRSSLAPCIWQNLLGNSAPLKLPAMLVKVKTPALPLHLAGETQRRI